MPVIAHERGEQSWRNLVPLLVHDGQANDIVIGALIVALPAKAPLYTRPKLQERREGKLVEREDFHRGFAEVEIGEEIVQEEDAGLRRPTVPHIGGVNHDTYEGSMVEGAEIIGKDV